MSRLIDISGEVERLEEEMEELLSEYRLTGLELRKLLPEEIRDGFDGLQREEELTDWCSTILHPYEEE